MLCCAAAYCNSMVSEPLKSGRRCRYTALLFALPFTLSLALPVVLPCFNQDIDHTCFSAAYCNSMMSKPSKSGRRCRCNSLPSALPFVLPHLRHRPHMPERCILQQHGERAIEVWEEMQVHSPAFGLHLCSRLCMVDRNSIQ